MFYHIRLTVYATNFFLRKGILMSLFFLEAFEKVYKSKVIEYEKMSNITDQKVRDTEPGMLLHAQTRISENELEVTYRWMEVFENYEAFEAHLKNPFVEKHIKRFTENKILSGPVEVKIHCDWSEEKKREIFKIPGIELSFIPLVNGYFR